MDNSTTEERLLTPGEVADILQVSKAKAYMLLQRREITKVCIGSCVRVRKCDLERYIREKTEIEL